MSPFLARQLSYTDNGTYGQLNMINNLVAILFSLGLVSIVNLLLVEERGNEAKVVRSNFWVLLISSAVCSLALLLGAGLISGLFKNESLYRCLIFYIPALIFNNLTNCVTYYYVYFNKARQLAVITVGTNLARIASVFWAVKQPDPLYHIILYSNIILFVQFLVYLYYIRQYVLPFGLPDWKYIRYSLQLAMPYLILNVVSFGILYVNDLVVSRQLGVEQFALYRNGAIEIPFIATLYNSVSTVAMPEIVRLTKQNEVANLLLLKRRISNTVAAVVFPVVFFCIFNGNSLITIYLSDRYAASGLVFSLYSIAVLIRINLYSDILTALKKPVQIIKANLLAFSIGIISALAMVKIWGIYGSALAYSVSIFAMSFFMVYSTTTALKVRMTSYFDFPTILKIAIVCVVLAYISSFFVTHQFVRIVVVAIVYGITAMVLFFKIKLIDLGLLPGKVMQLLTRMKIL